MIYIYLARRDKKEIKIVSVMQGKCIFTKLNDIQSLRLPPTLEDDLTELAYNHRMMWELCMEGFNSYQELFNSLTKRGFTCIPMAPVPMLSLPIVDISRQKGQKVMIKRSSSIKD